MKNIKNNEIKEIKIEELEYKELHNEREKTRIDMWIELIKEDKEIRPVLVHKKANGNYFVYSSKEIVIAAKQLGYKTIPCIVNEKNNKKNKYKNIQRQRNKKFELDIYGKERLRFLEEYLDEEYKELSENGKLIQDIKTKQKEANEMHEKVFKELINKDKNLKELEEKDLIKWFELIRKYSNIATGIALDKVIYND